MIPSSRQCRSRSLENPAHHDRSYPFPPRTVTHRRQGNHSHVRWRTTLLGWRCSHFARDREAIASGYEDCDDLDALRIDPAFKMACGRRPETGKDLMSQPTLSRFENAPSWRPLARMAFGMIDLICASFSRVPGRIVLDIDDTDDPAHGQQELILFNTHSAALLPADAYLRGRSGKSVLSLLRPGKRPSGEEIAQVLRRVIARIRRNWPRVEIMVRGDSHYAAPEVLDSLEERRCSYILGLSTNARLAQMARPWAEDAATRLALAKKERVRRFHQTAYRAGSWSKRERSSPAPRPPAWAAMCASW